jgi:hypothetical protein
LQVRNESGAVSGRDAKFRRLKLKSSKRVHPDASSASAAECERPPRVFQEFWLVLEEIPRS